MNITIKNIFIGFLSFLLLSLITVLGILWNFSNNIPDYKFLKNYKPPVSSKVYSGNGSLVADFSKEKRIFVPYRAIPKNVINSFLSAEDKNFFSHPGVDAKGVLRATINNIQNIMTSKRLEGASTITQQVAKNFKAECTPEFYLFNSNQKLVYRGRMDETSPGSNNEPSGKDLRKAINNLQENKPISEDQFPSMGCNIKWKT